MDRSLSYVQSRSLDVERQRDRARRDELNKVIDSTVQMLNEMQDARGGAKLTVGEMREALRDNFIPFFNR